jgi:hypothetical protein
VARLRLARQLVLDVSGFALEDSGPPRRCGGPALFTLFLLTLLMVGAGCRHVVPYERGALARPDMTTDELAGPAAQHLNTVHEGALQPGSVAASGCGCN